MGGGNLLGLKSISDAGGLGMTFGSRHEGEVTYITMVRRYSFELRPYTTIPTASRPICAVKQSMAESVLWWGTTWEYSVL